MVDIRIEHATRRFGSVAALDDISLDFPSGTFTSLLGPSGCGKTTLLRLIAGFEIPDEGSVGFDGEVMADGARHVPPEKRGVGVVFQSYALWPHMDVAGNVAYPLATRGMARKERDSRVRDVLSIVGLSGFETRRIDELSGGQRQRVALARCLVADARIILFDEPLANLDMHLRASMVEVFRDVHRRTGATMVYVTHDQAEALALSDRIAVMDHGRILQLGAPTEIYRSPAHDKVARFVGRGVIVDAEIVARREGSAVLSLAGHEFAARFASTPLGEHAKVLLRPEGLKPAENGISCRVLSTVYRGPVFEVSVALPRTQEAVVIDCLDAPAIGSDLKLAIVDAWVIPD
ncbi:ABC transporter ATP-binding protein [Aliihoeflea sp. PC F10.4]